MEMAHNVSIPELTEAISARLVAQWEAWKNQDAASNNAIILKPIGYIRFSAAHNTKVTGRHLGGASSSSCPARVSLEADRFRDGLHPLDGVSD